MAAGCDFSGFGVGVDGFSALKLFRAEASFDPGFVPRSTVRFNEYSLITKTIRKEKRLSASRNPKHNWK